MGGVCSKGATDGKGSSAVAVPEESIPLDDLDGGQGTKSVTFSEFLVSDGFVDMFKGTLDGRPVIVRRLLKKKLEDPLFQLFVNDCQAMKNFDHPNVMPFLGASITAPNLCYVTPLFQKILETPLHDKAVNMDFDLKLKIVRQIAEGVNYLHTRDTPFRHDDLKTRNIMIGSDWQIIVSDFGFSALKSMRMQSINHESAVGTDPVVLKGEPQSLKSDVYSFAILMWEIYTREVPFPNINQLKVAHDAMVGVRPPIPKGCPEPYVQVMQAGWDPDPDKRPSFAEIIKMLSANM